MKGYKIITIITIFIFIAIISLASFVGIYKLKDYKIINKVPNYVYGKEFSKSRSISLKVDDSAESSKIYDKDGNEVTEPQEGVEYTEANGYTTVETKVNPEDSITKDNFEKSKDILIKRIRALGIEQYTISLNNETGEINIDIPEDDKTENNISILNYKGVFGIKDSQTGEVLLDNNNIKTVKVVMGQVDETNTGVFLQIKFDKEGAKKLEEISNIYVEVKKEDEQEEVAEEEKETETESEESLEPEEETEAKEITIFLDDNEITTKHFSDTINTGVLNIGLGAASTNNAIQTYIDGAKQIVVVANNGVLPITYVQTNEVKNNSVNILENKGIIYSAISISVLAFLFLVIKLKFKGILAAALQIGYIALLLLVLRYTNIKVTITGIVGIIISILLNYLYIYSIFKNIELDFMKDTTAKFGLRLIPIYIISITFTFSKTLMISSFGMTIVWGIIMMYLYNLSLTHIAIKTINDK